ncbi:MAG TPA: hypothetical protein VNM40_01635 [Candidatus Paceibacterota bacterium]|nr:hypothetical protein [Candidatus Paceibacterota bacterium]
MVSPESGNRGPDRRKVLGIPEMSGVYMNPDKFPIDLMGPLARIANGLRSLREIANEREREEIMREINEVHLPRLRDTVSYFAKNGDVGDAITLDGVREAMRYVEEGGRIVRALARMVVDTYTTIPDPGKRGSKVVQGRRVQLKDEKRERAIDLLNDDPDFQRLIKYVSYVDPSAPHGKVYAELARALKDTAQNILGTKLKIRARDLWKRDPSSEDVQRVFRRAFEEGSDLSRTLDRLFWISTIPGQHDAEGNPKRVVTAIEEAQGKFRIPSAYPQEPVLSAQNAYLWNSPRDTLIIDRPFWKGEGADRRYVSVGYGFSKIAYALEKESPDRAKDELQRAIEEMKDLVRAKLRNVADLSAHEITAADEASLEEILAQVNEKSVRDMYRGKNGAKSEVHDENKGTRAERAAATAALDAKKVFAAQRDPFVQLDRALAARIFSLTSRDGRSLSQLLLGASGEKFKNMVYGGVWEDPSVEAAIEAEDSEKDIGIKTTRTLEFINSLPDIMALALEQQQVPKQERENLLLAAEALHNVIMRMELRRRMDDASEDAAGVKGGAGQTAGIQRSYAEAYGTLFNRKLVAPLKWRADYPEQREGEDDAAYNAQIARAVEANKRARSRASEQFRDERGAVLIEETRLFLQRMNNNEELRGSYFGTLAFATGIGATKDATAAQNFKKAIREEMELLRRTRGQKREDTRTPEEIESGRTAFHPERGLMQLREPLRAYIDSLESRCLAVEDALNEYERHANDAFNNAQRIDDPKILGVLIDWIQDLRDAVDDDVTHRVFGLKQEIARFRPQAIAKISPDPNYQLLWSQTAGPLLTRFDRLVPRRNNVHDTILLALSIAYVRRKLIEYRAALQQGVQLPEDDRKALEGQLRAAELLTTLYAYPHMLNSGATHAISQGPSVKIPSFKQLLPKLYGVGIERELKLERI